MSTRIARFIVAALFLAVTVVCSQAKTYIVACGISDYPGKDKDLPNPANDARAVAWLFNKNRQGNVDGELLINKNATRQNILNAMTRVFGRAKPEDTVLLFFSGHGVRGSVVAYDTVIPFKELSDILAASPARNKIVIADACFSGKFREAGSSADLEALARNGSVMLFLSSRGDESSIDSPELSNGLFTAYIMRALRGRADRDSNRVITARELYEYVSEGVVKMSAGKQHPVMWGNFKDNMPVVIWPKNKRK